MALYAVVQFISGSAGTLAKHAVFIVAVLGPPITVLLTEATLMDLAISLGDPAAQQPLQSLRVTAHRLSIPIVLLVVGVCGVAWLLGARRRGAESPGGRIGRLTRLALPYTTTAIVTAAIGRATLGLSLADPAAHLSPAEAWVWVILLASVVVCQSIGLSFQNGVEISRRRRTIAA